MLMQKAEDVGAVASPDGDIVGSAVSGDDVFVCSAGERDIVGAVVGLSLQLISTTVQMNCSLSHLHDARYIKSLLSEQETGWYLQVMVASIEQGAETSSSVGHSMEFSGSGASVGRFGANETCIVGAPGTGDGLGDTLGCVCVEGQLSAHVKDCVR